ncbi:hypothetical protein F2Q69_00029722 [Brassica cretica]|uniref:Uncharacterized protein n=1 Tax=Brassica cretica TaxID=69181 RepID=A0A8S9S0I5_BRACR|nr:hypothetical protein F2Q69_00029722 [Brassica cretica]
MEGSPYRKSFISWKGGRSLGLVPGFLLAGTWSVPLSGTRGPGSCPEAGGNDTGHPTEPENTRKWSGNKRDSRIPLSMAKIALRADVHGKAISWELGTTL